MPSHVIKEIKLIFPHFVPEWENLQSLCLSQAKDFKVRPEAARWYPVMNHSPTLGVFHDSKLLSVMRLSWYNSWPELNVQMNSKIIIDEIKFPVGYLSKGATHPDFMNSGFNALMRYHFIKICQELKLHFLMGTMIEGSSRVETMKKMGYKFTLNPVPWQGYYQSEKKALIGFLNIAQDSAKALEYLENQFSQQIREYQIQFEMAEIKKNYPY